MAKYEVIFSCGHQETVQLFGKNKDRERWIEWAEQNKLCPDCYQEAKEEQRKQATATAVEENIAYGLPSLTGSEKQIAWAETLRAEKIKEIEGTLNFVDGNLERLTAAGKLPEADEKAKSEGFESSTDLIECVHEAADLIMQQTSAHWWIEIRTEKIASILMTKAKEVAQARKEAVPEAVAAKTEAVIRPENPLTETVAEIRIHEKSIEVVFPEKREDFWQIIKKQLGYTWSGTAWTRAMGIRTGPPVDRAAEAGNRLLVAGFIVRIFDPAVREAAVNGTFEPECTRWVMKRTSGQHARWFTVTWPARDERLYNAARKLKGSKYDNKEVVVPAEQFEEVLDFARLYGFRLSPGAQEIADHARQLRDAALVAKPAAVEPPRLPQPGDKPAKLVVPEQVEVADEFQD